jgi:hypothetical protein
VIDSKQPKMKLQPCINELVGGAAIYDVYVSRFMVLVAFYFWSVASCVVVL